MKGALMVCGTGSDVGKTHVVTGLCRLLHRQGLAVAPFKAQNMALNSYVTPSGHEIGRAQGVQALAAGCEPEVTMNPILLKPTGERTSQVVVGGRPAGHFDASTYHLMKPELFRTVTAALADLRRRFDVVVLEGAGSAAEINLLDHDLVNLRLAAAAEVPAVVVGDIDRGGVFAALFGTVALLPADLRRWVKGFIINKFRGDRELLGDATAELERRCGVPTLGVVPYLFGVGLDAEDSLILTTAGSSTHLPTTAGDPLDVAVIRLPRISNFTDFDALALEPGVRVRYVSDAASVGRPDLIVLPGTKATVADLHWLRRSGLDQAIARSQAAVLGVCGGFQMMGRSIIDDVESGADVGPVEGLGWLDVVTRFAPGKLTRQRQGEALGQPVAGYEIRHGRVVAGAAAAPWVHLRDGSATEAEGACAGRMRGTSLHGLFDNDGFRAAFLADVARHSGKPWEPSGVSFAAAREAQIDRLADALGASVDMAAVGALVKGTAT